MSRAISLLKAFGGFGVIAFSPRSPLEEKIFGESVVVLSRRSSLKCLHVSDLIENPAGVVTAIEIAKNHGIAAEKIIPHLSVEAELARMKDGKSAVSFFKNHGIAEILLLRGVPKNSSATRQAISKSYDEKMLGGIRDLSQSFEGAFKIRLTFYPENHSKSYEVMRRVGPNQLQRTRYEMDNLKRKIEVICAVTKRDPQEIISGIVFQHGYNPDLTAHAASELRTFFDGLAIPIIPTILPIVRDPKLLRAFSANKNASLSAEVESISQKIDKVLQSGDALALEKIMQEEANPYSIKICNEIVQKAAPNQVLWYIGSSGAKDLCQILDQCEQTSVGQKIASTNAQPSAVVSDGDASGLKAESILQH